MRAQDLAAAVVREVDEVVRDQPVVHRHDDRAQLRHRVILLEVLMRVGCQRCYAVALLHAQLRQCRRPSVATLAERFVRQSQITIDHGFARSMELACATQEIERGEWCFHAEGRGGAG